MPVDQQLTSLLTQELESLQQLLLCLEQEHQALSNNEIDAIEHATAAKNQALSNQNAATLSRQKLHPTALNTGNSLQQLISSCDNSDQLRLLTEQLNTVAQLCHDSNRLNGKLINQKQQQTQSALNIIRQSGPTAAAYSGRGDAISSQSPRSLGKA